MESVSPPARKVKTAETIFRIIEALRELDGASVAELADHLDLANSTVHDHLATLKYMNFVVKDGEVYRIGLRFLDYGAYAKHKYAVTRVARPTLKRLSKETGERVWLYVEEHGYTISVLKIESDDNVNRGNYKWVGRHQYMHCTAGGKAILAYLPDEDIETVVERHGLTQKTPNTITDFETLVAELETIRNRRYASNDGESTENIRAVASPIIVDDDVLGAVSVAAPKHRLQDETFHEILPNVVMGATDEIELNMRDLNNVSLVE